MAHGSTSFTQVVHPAATVVEAHGELDGYSASALADALQQAVEGDRPLLVLDLADVSFLDSAGLAVIFRAQRLLPVSRRLMLANVPDRMTRVLRLAGINAIVGVHTPGEPEPWLEEA